MASTYEKTVAENLSQMGTPKHEWQAVPVTDIVETAGPTGAAVTMPVFQFPEGYSPAPSMFSKQDGCCQLCGHDIKNVFWLQNDVKKWTLPVGSECVTHFAEGENGGQLAKRQVREKQAAENRERVKAFRASMAAIFAGWTYKSPRYWLGQLSHHETVWGLHRVGGREAKQVYDAAKAAIGDMTEKVCHDGSPAWTDRQIANRLKKHADALAASEKAMAELLVKMEGLVVSA